MLDRSCPNCNKLLKFSFRCKLLKEPTIRCPYCCKDLQFHNKYQLLNAAVFGVITAFLCWGIFRLSVEWIIIVSVVVGHFTQKYLDVFFPLEVAKLD